MKESWVGANQSKTNKNNNIPNRNLKDTSNYNIVKYFRKYRNLPFIKRLLEELWLLNYEGKGRGRRPLRLG